MRRLLGILFMIAISTSVYADLSTKITMDFRDADVRDIVKLIAKQADLGIVSQKSVRGNMTLFLKDVTAREALDIVAKASGFAWKKIGNTVLLADEKQFDREIKVLDLKYLSAEEVAKIISMSIVGDIKIATCSDNNGIVINGTRETIEQAMLIIGKIDRPQEYVKGTLKVLCGEKVINKFDFSARAGESVSIKENLKFARSEAGKGSDVAAIKFDIYFRGINGAGLLDADMKLGMTRIVASQGLESKRNYTGQFQVSRGKTVEVMASSQNDPVKFLFSWEK